MTFAAPPKTEIRTTTQSDMPSYGSGFEGMPNLSGRGTFNRWYTATSRVL